MFAGLTSVTYCIWTLDRGFEITDESYYVLLAKYPLAIKLFNSAQHWITSVLWTVTKSLPEFRAVGLGTILLSALILALGVLRISTENNILIIPGRENKFSVISCTLAGALLYGSTINFSPCYNLITVAASYSAIGLILFAVNKPASWLTSILYLLVGGLIGVASLCKIPAGAAILILTLLIQIKLEPIFKKKISGLIQILTGTSLALISITLSQTTFDLAIKEFQLGMFFFKLVQSEPISIRLIRYSLDFFHHLIFSYTQFILPIACFVIYAFTRYKKFFLLGIFTLIVIIVSQGYLLGGGICSPYKRIDSQATVMIVILCLSLLSTFAIWTKNWNTRILTGTLLILPYCVAFGTGNQIHTQIIIALASWGTLIAILAHANNLTWQQRIPPLLLCVIFVSISATQVVTSGFPAPYHMNSSILEQSRPIKIGVIGTIKVDNETHKFITTLSNAVKKCDISPDRPFLGLYNIPGVALVIQGVPVFTPWLNNPAQTEALANIVPPETLRSAIVGIKLLPNGALPQFTKLLPNFPNDYIQCGKAIYPYMQQEIELWVPKTR